MAGPSDSTGSYQRCFCWQDRQSTGGCQSSLVEKLGVSLSQYHHIMVRISNHPWMNNRPIEAAVLRSQSRPIIANLPLGTYQQNCLHFALSNNPAVFNHKHRAALCSDVSVSLHLYLTGVHFEYRPRYQLIWLRLFVVFFCLSMQIPGIVLNKPQPPSSIFISPLAMFRLFLWGLQVQSVLLQRVSLTREFVHTRKINRGIDSPKHEIVIAHTRFFTHTTQHFVLRMKMSFLPRHLHNSEATTLHHTQFHQQTSCLL
jgi:hypothetical protein